MRKRFRRLAPDCRATLRGSHPGSKHNISINLGSFEVMLSSDGPGGPGLSVDELKRIASSITASGQISDPSTWLDAAEAIPVG